MIDKLEEIQNRFNELEKQISDPDIMKDMGRYKEIAQEHSHLVDVVDEIKNYKRLKNEISDARQLIQNEKDAEMRGNGPGRA